jgi:hypothetical protein
VNLLSFFTANRLFGVEDGVKEEQADDGEGDVVAS